TRLPEPPTSPLFPYTTLFRSTNSLIPNHSKNFNPPQKKSSIPSTSPAPESPSSPTAKFSGAAASVKLTSRRIATSPATPNSASRSEEHTSELQSQSNLVCRLL